MILKAENGLLEGRQYSCIAEENIQFYCNAFSPCDGAKEMI